MLPGAEFIHPIRGGASFRPKAPGETEHRQRPRRLPGRRHGIFLPVQPDQQLPGMRLVQLFNLLHDHLNCAHAGSVAYLGSVATSAIGRVSVSPGCCYGKGSVNEMVMFPARIGQRVQASVLSTRLQKRGQTLPAGHAHHSQPSIQLNGVVVSAPAGDAQRNARSTSNRAGLLGNTPTK